jgi:blocked-early-in-transport protein 1
LWQLSIDIGDEVRGQNRFLNDMDENFDSAGGFLAGSMKRVMNMGKAGHNRWMCYMMIFIIIVFFVVYYIISWRRT